MADTAARLRAVAESLDRAEHRIATASREASRGEEALSWRPGSWPYGRGSTARTPVGSGRRASGRATGAVPPYWTRWREPAFGELALAAARPTGAASTRSSLTAPHPRCGDGADRVLSATRAT